MAPAYTSPGAPGTASGSIPAGASPQPPSAPPPAAGSTVHGLTGGTVAGGTPGGATGGPAGGGNGAPAGGTGSCRSVRVASSSGPPGPPPDPCHVIGVSSRVRGLSRRSYSANRGADGAREAGPLIRRGQGGVSLDASRSISRLRRGVLPRVAASLSRWCHQDDSRTPS